MDGLPDPLPGDSSAVVLLRSLRWIAAAFATALPIGLESLLPRRAVVPWGVGWVVVALVLLGLYGRDTVRGRRLERREVERGYTTALATARSRPDLWLLDRHDLRVLSGPWQPRPPTVRRVRPSGPAAG